MSGTKFLTASLFICGIAIVAGLQGCADPEPPYPPQDYAFSGDYAVLGFGFDDQNRYFQQRSLVNATDNAISGTDLIRTGPAAAVAGTVSAGFTLDQTGALSIVPSSGGSALLPAKASFGASPVIAAAKLLGGPSELIGHVHQPIGDVAYVGDFETSNFQELQIFLRRTPQSYSNGTFAGRWAMATMYWWSGSFYTLTGYMDANANGGVDNFFEYFYNSADPTTPSTASLTRPDGYWNVGSDGKMSYGPLYQGYVCGNQDVYLWDAIEYGDSVDFPAPAVGVRMDVGGYDQTALDGSYIIGGIEANQTSGARSCLGGLIRFESILGVPYFHLQAKRNVRGGNPQTTVDVEGTFTIASDGELRLMDYGGGELLRGYVGARGDNDVSDRAVAVPLTTTDTFGMYFIGR